MVSDNVKRVADILEGRVGPPPRRLEGLAGLISTGYRGTEARAADEIPISYREIQRAIEDLQIDLGRRFSDALEHVVYGISIGYRVSEDEIRSAPGSFRDG